MKKISDKKLAKLGGKMPFSTIASPRKAVRKSKRSKSEFARIYGSKARVAFVKGLNCVVCMEISPFFGVATIGRCHNAHTETGGMGRKADYTTIAPLCASHHRRYDEYLPPCDDPVIRDAIKGTAIEVERRWQDHLAGRRTA